MSDVQRWNRYSDALDMFRADEGDWVTYADHVAAMREAVRDVRSAAETQARIDHVEALRQAEARWSDLYAQASVDSGEQSVEHYRDGYQRAVVEERKKWQDFARDNWQSGYEQGQRDALANNALINEIRNEQFQKGLEAAVQRVEALRVQANNPVGPLVFVDDAIAAIKGTDS